MQMRRTMKWLAVLGAVGCGGSGDEQGGKDTQGPTVGLVASALRVTQAGALTLSASASDAAAITRVEFFDGPTKVGEDAEAPYRLELPLTHAHNGVHPYSARAVDAAGNEGRSDVLSVQVEVDGAGPAVSLTASSTQVAQAGLLTLSANASDDVGVVRVEFYDGETLLDVDGDAPFSVQVLLSRALNGAHAYRARALDAAGNGVASEPVAVQVAVPWTQQLGAAGDDEALGVAVDAQGSVYVTGYTYGAMAEGGYGYDDVYLARYAPDGSLLWVRQFGSDEGDSPSQVAVGADGSVYVVGNTYGAMHGETSRGYTDLFLVKFAPDGTRQWTRQLGSSSDDYSSAVAVDAQGNVLVVGNTYGTLPGQTSSGAMDFVLARYAADGTLEWARQLGTSTYDYARGVATDREGNAYVAGNTSGRLGADPAAGGNDTVLLKLTPTGAVEWARQTGSPTDEYVGGVAVDAAGNVYVGGTTYGALEGDASAGQSDLFLMRFSPQGTRAWTRQVGGSSYEWTSGVAVDAAGSVYLSASTESALGGPADRSGNALLVSYSVDGARRWAQQVGTSGSDWGNHVAAALPGGVYLVGGTEGALDAQASYGGTDSFLTRFEADGTRD